MTGVNKRKSRAFVKRHVMTFKIGDRPRRGLLHRKKVYEMWFEFAKRAESLPADFGDVHTTEFETWWRDPLRGFELFCEQPKDKFVREIEDVGGDDFSKRDDESFVYLEVPITKDYAQLMAELERYVATKQKELGSDAIISTARFPVVGKYEYEGLKTCLKAYDYSQQGLKRWEIAVKMKKAFMKDYNPKVRLSHPKDNESAIRSISRMIQRAKKIIHNVENGVFPG